MAIEGRGFELLGHFTFPDEAWWCDFYTPMQNRIQELNSVYVNDIEASGILE